MVPAAGSPEQVPDGHVVWLRLDGLVLNIPRQQGVTEFSAPTRGVGPVGLCHAGADLGDFGGDVGPLGQLADAVVAAYELNFLAYSLVRPGMPPGSFPPQVPV